jgi:hypothetical protein
VYGGGFNDGQNIITSKLQINFGAQGEFIELSGFFGFEEDDDINSIVGLQTVNIVPTGTTKYKVVTKCDKQNLYDLYSSQIGNKNVWSVTKASDGTAVTISTVTANAATKDFTVTFSAPSEKYYVSLVSVSALETAGVVGYESERLTVNP